MGGTLANHEVQIKHQASLIGTQINAACDGHGNKTSTWRKIQPSEKWTDLGGQSNLSGIEGIKDCNSKSEQENLTYGRHGHPSLMLKKKY